MLDQELCSKIELIIPMIHSETLTITPPPIGAQPCNSLKTIILLKHSITLKL